MLGHILRAFRLELSPASAYAANVTVGSRCGCNVFADWARGSGATIQPRDLWLLPIADDSRL